MTNPHKKDVSAANRYLNLAGAPWSPDKPDRAITPTMMYVGAASAAAISLATYFMSASNAWTATANFGGGALAGAAVIGMAGRTRRAEARNLSPNYQNLVIDMAPGKNATSSPDILSKSINYAASYRTHITTDEIIKVMGYGLLSFQPENSTHLLSIRGALGCAALLTGWAGSERRRQFERIASGEWVVTDSGNAIEEFRTDDHKKLLSAKVFAMVPIPINPPERK